MRIRVGWSLVVLLAWPGLAQARRAAPQGAEAEAALARARDAAKDGFAVASWHSPALSGDKLGDSGEARAGVELPDREKECLQRKARCWLVVFLPGFDAPAESFHAPLAGRPDQSLSAVLKAVNAHSKEPVVVVIPDGRTRLGGGWYVDSPTSGEWERFVMEELLPAARDALAPGTPAARTLVMGHSMGGFGALNLGMKHPSAFHGVAAFNAAARPAELADEALSKLDASGAAPDPEARMRDPNGHFYERVLLSMGGAFFPDPKAPHGLPPLFDTAKHPWKLNPAAREAFERFDVAAHADALGPIPRVQLYAGRADPLVRLPQLQAIADAANGTRSGPGATVGLDAGAPPSAKRVPVELVITDGDHLSHLAEDLKQALETLAR